MLCMNNFNIIITWLHSMILLLILFFILSMRWSLLKGINRSFFVKSPHWDFLQEQAILTLQGQEFLETVVKTSFVFRQVNYMTGWFQEVFQTSGDLVLGLESLWLLVVRISVNVCLWRKHTEATWIKSVKIATRPKDFHRIIVKCAITRFENVIIKLRKYCEGIIQN